MWKKTVSLTGYFECVSTMSKLKNAPEYGGNRLLTNAIMPAKYTSILRGRVDLSDVIFRNKIFFSFPGVGI